MWGKMRKWDEELWWFWGLRGWGIDGSNGNAGGYGCVEALRLKIAIILGGNRNVYVMTQEGMWIFHKKIRIFAENYQEKGI